MERRLFLYVRLLGIVPGAAMAWATWVTRADGLRTMGGHVLVVRDYLWLWAAGHLLRAGDVATVFQPGAFADRLREQFGATLDNHVWSYPPPMLLLALPAGHLSLVGGYLLFIAAQAALFWWVGRAAGLPRAARVAVLISPALLANMLTGQNGAMTAALLVGGLLFAGRRPVLAGVLFGLLTVKPQLGLVVPVCLLAAGNWRAIFSAIGTAAALFLASGLAFGFGAWRLFVANTMPYQALALEQPWNGSVYQMNIVTPFIAARFFGVGLAAAYALQALCAIVAGALAWRIWRLPAANPLLRMAATVALGMLMTPYALTYDMIAVAAGIACIAAAPGGRPAGVLEMAALSLAWLWPGLALPLGIVGAPPVGAVLLAGVAWVGWRRLKREHAVALAPS
jgi:hypothetical protein